MRSGSPKRMSPTKARRAIDALVRCLECVDLEGDDVVALEDARAALNKYEEDGS